MLPCRERERKREKTKKRNRKREMVREIERESLLLQVYSISTITIVVQTITPITISLPLSLSLDAQVVFPLATIEFRNSNGRAEKLAPTNGACFACTIARNKLASRALLHEKKDV